MGGRALGIARSDRARGAHPQGRLLAGRDRLGDRLAHDRVAEAEAAGGIDQVRRGEPVEPGVGIVGGQIRRPLRSRPPWPSRRGSPALPPPPASRPASGHPAPRPGWRRFPGVAPARRHWVRGLARHASSSRTNRGLPPLRRQHSLLRSAAASPSSRWASSATALSLSSAGCRRSRPAGPDLVQHSRRARLAAAPGSHDQHRQLGHARPQVGEKAQRGLVDPLQIVDAEHQRRPLAEVGAEPVQAVQQGEDRIAPGLDLGPLEQRPGECGRALEGGAAAAGDQRVEQLQDDAEGKLALQLRAAGGGPVARSRRRSGRPPAAPSCRPRPALRRSRPRPRPAARPASRRPAPGARPPAPAGSGR